MDKSNRDPNNFSFFSWRGTYGERPLTAQEVFERNKDMIKNIRESIERRYSEKAEKTD